MRKHKHKYNAGREAELTLQLREAESRCVDQARRREKGEREAAELKETSKKMRQALEGEEKIARELRWELEDRQQMAAAEVCSVWCDLLTSGSASQT